jgi:ABC-type uncharacterized transport system involved in gliding motility auxiliary subunit
MRLQPVSANLEPLLENYGIKLTHSLVLDRKQNARTQFPVRQGRMVFQALINYPLHPLATTFDRESVIVRDVDRLAMPFAQVLGLTDAARANTARTYKALISSGESSSIKKDGAAPPTDPQVLSDETQATDEDPGPFPLAYTAEGTFTSFWTDKPLPNDDGTLDGRTAVKESPRTRMLVVGSAEFLRGAGDVFLNIVDWLAQDEELIAIRSRGETLGPLKVLEPTTQRAISLANVVGLPLAFLAFGVVRWRMRKRAQEKGE